MQTLKSNFVNSIHTVDLASVFSPEMDHLHMQLAMISNEVSLEVAHQSTKLFKTKKMLGEYELHKILCFILKNFADTVKVPQDRKIKNFEIIQVAHTIMQNYTHDSLDDIILAFKLAQQSGRKFYNQLSQADIYDILNDYFENKKPEYLEHRVLDYKSEESTMVLGTLSAIQEKNPEIISSMSKMIVDADQNKDHKRLRLSLDKAKAKRGIEQARTGEKKPLDTFEKQLHERINQKAK